MYILPPDSLIAAAAAENEAKGERNLDELIRRQLTKELGNCRSFQVDGYDEWICVVSTGHLAPQPGQRVKVLDRAVGAFDESSRCCMGQRAGLASPFNLAVGGVVSFW